VRRSKPLLLVGVAVVVALVIAVVVGQSTKRVTIDRSSTTSRLIPGDGGTLLSAVVIKPRGSGKHPLLVMPSSWGSSANEYVIAGLRLAAKGYLVISYAQRGSGESRGKLDFAGKPTQADLSAVISWALKHTSADPKAVGVAGISYGAGTALLAAEHDARIKAVVAMSGWADLAKSFYPNRTPNQAAITAVFQSKANGRMSKPLTDFVTKFFDGQTLDAATSWAALAPTRSAIDGVVKLNKNHPAVMLANGYQDAILPPSQLVPFFNALTGPKRLQLAVGGHTQPEGAGLVGRPDKTWDDATAWFDHYLRHRANGIDAQHAVQLQDVVTGAWHSYRSWADVGHASRLYLGQPTARGTGDGELSARPAAWSYRIDAGWDSTANAPPLQANGARYQAASLPMSGISHQVAGVWQGLPTSKPTLVSGSPVVQLTVTPSTPNASLFAYLLDVDGASNGALVTFEPYTLFHVPPNVPRAIGFALEPIAWMMPTGHHLALVIDTVDPRYQTFSTRGSAVTFSSAAGYPSALAIPTG
jgi:predicted acyl esterase